MGLRHGSWLFALTISLFFSKVRIIYPQKDNDLIIGKFVFSIYYAQIPQFRRRLSTIHVHKLKLDIISL